MSDILKGSERGINTCWNDMEKLMEETLKNLAGILGYITRQEMRSQEQFIDPQENICSISKSNSSRMTIENYKKTKIMQGGS